MRTLIWIPLFVCAWSSAAYAQNGSTGRFRKTDLLPAGEWSVTAEFEHIFSRDLDDGGVSGIEDDGMGGITPLVPGTAARRVELESNALLVRLAYSLYAPADDSFGLEGLLLLGAADVELDGGVSDGGPLDVFNVDGDFGVVFGGGLRSRLFKRDQFTVFADGSVRFSEHDSDITQVGELNLDVDPGDTARQDFDTRVLAWHIAAFVTFEIEAGRTTLLPYAGIKLSGVDVNVDGAQDFFDPGGAFDKSQTIDYGSHQSDILGLFAGVEAGFTENFSAYFEVRVIDEFAIALGGTFTF